MSKDNTSKKNINDNAIESLKRFFNIKAETRWRGQLGRKLNVTRQTVEYYEKQGLPKPLLAVIRSLPDNARAKQEHKRTGKY